MQVCRLISEKELKTSSCGEEQWAWQVPLFGPVVLSWCYQLPRSGSFTAVHISREVMGRKGLYSMLGKGNGDRAHVATNHHSTGSRSCRPLIVREGRGTIMPHSLLPFLLCGKEKGSDFWGPAYALPVHLCEQRK